MVGLSAGREGVIDDAKRAIQVDGWKEMSIYAAITGHLGGRRVHKDDAAKGLLDEAERKSDKTAWPYPVVQYLRGEIDEKALMAQATDQDKETEARCYLGFDQLLKRRTDEARENFTWVKDRGTPGFTEITIAEIELERLEGAKP